MKEDFKEIYKKIDELDDDYEIFVEKLTDLYPELQK